MRFVPIKSVQQQSDLSLHRVRQGFVEERTATLNRIRGLIAEFGYVLPTGVEQLRRQVPDLIDRLPAQVARCVHDLLEHRLPTAPKVTNPIRVPHRNPTTIMAAKTADHSSGALAQSSRGIAMT